MNNSQSGKPYVIMATAKTGPFKRRVALVAGFDTLEEAQWVCQRLVESFGLSDAEVYTN